MGVFALIVTIVTNLNEENQSMRKINLGYTHTRYLINNPGQMRRYIEGAWRSNQLDLLTAYIKLDQALKTRGQYDQDGR